MSPKVISAGCVLFVIGLASGGLLGQSTPSASRSSLGQNQSRSQNQNQNPSPGIELPVTMRQNVSAGSTAVGTKVQAKLAVATLVNGVVIPVGATLSGEVTESVAKSATDPSRLAIYMDAAQWKNGSVSLKVYLTAWYYPEPTPTPQDSSLAPPDANPVVRARNRGGIYPDPTVNTSGTVPASDPYPGRDPGRESSPPLPAPGSNTPRHRVLMKDVESTRASEGALTLISKRSNLKLNKQTTYVFASGELLPLN